MFEFPNPNTNMEHVQSVIDFVRAWYWLPLLLLYVGIISPMLIENRNPAKTISWVLVIVFLPALGLGLYYLFGQKYTRERRIKRVNGRQAVRLKKEWERLEPFMERDMKSISERIGNLSRVYAFLKNERLSFPTLGNEAKLLINGEAKFADLLNSLRNARHSIHMEYYIFEPDQIGLEILQLLEAKAADGVPVRLLADSLGSSALVKHMRRKRNTKIMFRAFRPVTFASLANSNYRNHRKITVVDGKVGYIGGINIADRYINDRPTGGNQVYWRDTAVRICGPAVNMLQISFWNAWNLADGQPFVLHDGYLQGAADGGGPGNAAVSLVASDPGSAGPYNMEAILVAMGEADRKIQLTTPYYVPSDELATALKIAAASGITVELMLPHRSDSYIVRHAGMSFVKPLLERGVRVYFYKKGFMHAKTVNIDGKVSFIGTVNLDTRSFFINYEAAAVISDERLCAQLERQFERDKRDCHLMTLKEWKKRKVWKRAVDSLCRLLAPLL